MPNKVVRQFQSFDFAGLKVSSGAIYGRVVRFKGANGAIWAWLELPVFRMPNKVVCEPSSAAVIFVLFAPVNFPVHQGKTSTPNYGRVYIDIDSRPILFGFPVCGWIH